MEFFDTKVRDDREQLTVSKPVRKQTRTGNLTIGDEILRTASPFKPYMVKALNELGLNANDMPFRTVCICFYNEFSGGQKIDVGEFVNLVAFRIKTTEYKSDDILTSRSRLAVETVNTVLTMVIEVFRKAKNKYEACLKYGQEPKMVLDRFTLDFARAERIVYNKLLQFEHQSNFESHFEGSGYKAIFFFVCAIMVFARLVAELK